MSNRSDLDVAPDSEGEQYAFKVAFQIGTTGKRDDSELFAATGHEGERFCFSSRSLTAELTSSKRLTFGK